MEFKQAESFDRPVTEDAKSSPNGVYIRKNIVESEYTSEMTGETKIKYTYDEAFISQAEYAVLSATQYAVENASTVSNEEAIDNYTNELLENGII